MELKYVVLTIIKILISVPTAIFFQGRVASAAALMGGHLDNKNNSTNLAPLDYDYEFNNTKQESEEIPDPSALVLPGYNLPENIFNKGKPFYLEKDPLTGQIDFASKTSSDHVNDDMYEYVDEEPSSNIYDKANIDRKDGSLSSHRPSDVNQLTPNFHDFLNLPVKYNSDKYVYPLISSSYANTKIQGNVNKYHNHKDYNVKTSTYKPTGSPTYFGSTKNTYFTQPKSTTRASTTTTTTTTSTTTPSTTTEALPTSNLMNSPMNHPSFHEDFEDYYEPTSRPVPNKHIEGIYLTTTTTKRTMSLLEQLFGNFDDMVTTTEKTKPPPLFSNLPSNKNTKNKYDTEVKTEKPSFSTPGNVQYPNSHAGPNVITGTNVGSYEYEDYEGDTITSTTELSSSTTTTTTTSTTTQMPSSSSTTEFYDYYDVKENQTVKAPEPSVTSLPLGENHVASLNNNQPIIVATQNLREQLNNEKVVPKPFGFDKPPSTSSIHIAPDQDTVSFVVGHHQNVDGGQYVGTALKESPYDSNPFRPLYGQNFKDSVSYTIQGNPEPVPAGSAVTIQPQKNSEASLAIGSPINEVQQVPGQVVDEKLELEDGNLEYPKGTGTKIVFPDEKESVENMVPPPQVSTVLPNREVLKLNSKPMYHQLPSDLTPPKEREPVPPTRIDRPRPPWDPRPGHFYSGKPEYARPPRPPPDSAFKRIDTLPNVLPQFRPNMNTNVPQHYHNRQPLLDRPSNRPIGFFEKLQPPPPPKNLHNLRKIPPPPQQDLRPAIAEDRIINEAPKKSNQNHQFNYFQTPPKVVLPNRRIGNLEGDVETLQMIQAKKSEKKEVPIEVVTDRIYDSGVTDKPLYVVYPVNTPPIKLDVLDTNTKESVVIGTRAELPLPPSKINQNFDYEQNPILNPKDRNDAPILKPHPRPAFPIKSDFPYPLERPDPSILNPAVPESPSNGIAVDELDFSPQWESSESRIVTNGKPSNQISVTLKTYTEKPIAVAYTPTEPYYDPSKYSMPNYGSPVIPEIRPGTVEGIGKADNEFTVSAVMHTHPQLDLSPKPKPQEVHRGEVEDAGQDFQAPFQASVSVDSLNQGWAVVRNGNRSTTEAPEYATSLPLATTSEFDIENFKPQLIGGFKPIYSMPEEPAKTKEAEVSERQE